MSTIKPFPTGCIVITPTGRRAKVLRYVLERDEPRCELLYEDAKRIKGHSAATDKVVLHPSKLTLAPVLQ